jgi:PAS domain S-box-containing protein
MLHKSKRNHPNISSARAVQYECISDDHSENARQANAVALPVKPYAMPWRRHSCGSNVDVRRRSWQRFTMQSVFVLLFCGMTLGQVQAVTPVRIGVLAKYGNDRCFQKWTPTAEYLSNRMPAYQFRIVPLSFEQVWPAVRLRKIDFVLVNPAMYVSLEKYHAVSRLATLKVLASNMPCTRFAGVVIASSSRDDLRSLSDLEGLRFAAVDSTSLGGWLAAAREFADSGLDPHNSFEELLFLGTHIKVVQAVRTGRVDAGTVRTGTLEQMIEEGMIEPGQFKTLKPAHVINHNLPFAFSTRSYPEWPVAKLPTTPEPLAQQVAIALFQLSQDTEAARAADAAGWTIPLNYQDVHACMQELGVRPYTRETHMPFTAVMRFYWWIWLTGAALLILILAFAMYVLRLNRRLVLSRHHLSTELNQRQSIEKELHLRSAALETAANGIVIADREGFITYCNQAVTSLTGYTPSELIGKSTRIFRSDVQDPQAHEQLWRSITSGRTWHGQLINRRKDGSLYTEELTVAPIKNMLGEITHFVAVKQDITERVRLEAEQDNNLRFLQTLLNTIPSAIYYKDRLGRYLGCNNTFANWVGLDRGLIIGSDTSLLYPRDVAAGYKQRDEELLRHVGRQSFEGVLAPLRGPQRTVLFHKATFVDREGNPAGLVGVITDISERKQIEEKLAHSERVLTSTFNAMQDTILVLDRNHHIVMSNWKPSGIRAHTGPNRSLPCKHCFAELGLSCDPCLTEAVFRSGTSQQAERRSLVDGRDWEIRTSPILNDNNEVILVVEQLHDITTRKRALEGLAQERAALRCLIDSIPDLIVFKDSNGKYMGCNRAFEEYINLSESDVQGCTDYDLFPANQARTYRENDLKTLASDEPEVFEEWVDYPDGTRVFLDTRKTPMRDADMTVRGLIAVSRNDTERRQAAMEAQQAREGAESATRELQLINTQLQHAIEHANELALSAARANTAKSEFLANMSHELRTPLHGILSFANFGIKKHQHAPRQKLLEYFDRIHQSGDLLLDLLNDLLDLAKHEAGRIQYELKHTDLGALVTQVVDEFASLLSERNLSILWIPPEDTIDIYADGKRLQQVIRNLLSNAVKFSPPSGTIEIRLSSEENNARLYVLDHGPGIPEAELELVFDKFVQSSKTKSGAGGTGLGLALCKEIVEGHGGNIRARNRSEGGAQFTAVIPMDGDNENAQKGNEVQEASAVKA